jgi:hypothetical protein
LALLWTYSEQQTIRKISENNEQKWEAIATEVQFVKLKELMGANFYQDLVQNPGTAPNAKLLDGGTYTNGDITYQFKGLKYVLAYLFYERYIMEINAQDTFVGLMQNNNVNAQHTSYAQKKNMAQEYCRVAEAHWKDCQDFVCANAADYPYASFTKSGRISYF